MTFGEILYKLRKNRDLKQIDVAKQIGVQKNTISNYENDISKPNYDKLVQLCNLFQVNPNDLMKEDLELDNEKEIPSDIQQLKDKYDHLTPNNKSIVDYIFGMEEEVVEPTKIYYFPVFFQSAAAGIGQLSETNDYQMEELKLKTIPKEAKFGMYIVGDSMETDIYENDIVLIDPSQTMPDELDGEIVVTRFGDELVCKTLSVNIDTQTYDFLSNNSGASDKSRLNQRQGSFRLVGKVVRIIHANIIGEGIVTYHDD